MNYPKNPGFNMYELRHCAYITYSVKTHASLFVYPCPCLLICLPLFDSGVSFLLSAGPAGECGGVCGRKHDGDDLEDGQDHPAAQVGQQHRHYVPLHATLQTQ